MESHVSYIIISPVRDEEKYIEKTISSVISQTVKPTEWIIVNDGSNDNTGKVIEKYADQYNWIHVVHRTNRGYRKAGGGVIEAFYDGYDHVETKGFKYVVKLDGDLSFGSDYFEKCFEKFANNSKLGVGGGVIYNLINNKEVLEKTPAFHVRGATKIYKKDCWDAISGLIRAPGWDTLDEVKANMLGWESLSFFDLKVVHHRYTGQADGTWKNLVKNGLANYISGYHPIFMLLKCFKRLFQRPYIVGSVALLYGFISGYINNTSQIDDPDLIRYLRQQQFKRLLFMKTIWR